MSRTASILPDCNPGNTATTVSSSCLVVVFKRGPRCGATGSLLVKSDFWGISSGSFEETRNSVRKLGDPSQSIWSCPLSLVVNTITKFEGGA